MHHLCMISACAVYLGKFLTFATFGHHNYSQASQLTNRVSRIFMTDYSDKQFLGVTSWTLSSWSEHQLKSRFLYEIVLRGSLLFILFVLYSVIFLRHPFTFLCFPLFAILSSPPVPLPFSETALQEVSGLICCDSNCDKYLQTSHVSNTKAFWVPKRNFYG